MRIALLTSLPDSDRLSMALYDTMLEKSLKEVFPGEANPFFFPDSHNQKFTVKNGHLLSKLKRYAEQYFIYPQELKKVKADIYHITDHSYGHLVPFLDPHKTVITFHDALLPVMADRRLPIQERPLTSIWAQRYALRCMKNTAAILPVSDFSRSEFLRYADVSPERVHTVHEGVGEIFFKSFPEEEKKRFLNKWKIPHNKKIILMAGRTNPHKNIEGGLKAFHFLNKHYGSDALLVKMGNHFRPEQLDLIRRLGLTDRVYSLGSLSFQEVPLAYQVSSALLFLSFYEGFGFPTLEAMASGIPAVISNCAALPEIAGDAALLTDPQNIELAAENLHKALEDSPLRAQLIEKGRKRAASMSWKETAKKTMAIYRKVIS